MNDSASMKVGVLVWNQYTDWPAMLSVGQRADVLGYDSLWTWDPPPLQAHVPILIGGAGERKTLRTVARFADAWNVAQVTLEQAAHKVAVLDRWCDAFERDPASIERTLSLGPMVIRDHPVDAAKAVVRVKETNPRMEREVLTGSATEITERCREYAAAGFTHFIYHSPPPHDEETLERFVSEVRSRIR